VYFSKIDVMHLCVFVVAALCSEIKSIYKVLYKIQDYDPFLPSDQNFIPIGCGLAHMTLLYVFEPLYRFIQCLFMKNISITVK